MKKKGNDTISLKNARILVVEDENIIALDIQNILEDLGFLIAGIVDTGEESVRLASSTLPDLVIMDIKLKGQMDGIQAAELIYKKLRIPIIYVTAYGDFGTIQKLGNSAAFGFISKPFEEEEIRKSIHTVLSRFQKYKTSH
jgi:CheY-like chemotaxis protein